MRRERNKTVYRSYENIYDLKERQYESPHHRRCIDGSITGCGKCVGYCNYNGHTGFLTNKLRKEHDCIGKFCIHYNPKEKRNAGGFNTMANALAAVL